jgi:hypothetical protein
MGPIGELRGTVRTRAIEERRRMLEERGDTECALIQARVEFAKPFPLDSVEH